MKPAQPPSARSASGPQLVGSANWMRKRRTYGPETSKTSKSGATCLPTPSMTTSVLMSSQ